MERMIPTTTPKTPMHVRASFSLPFGLIETLLVYLKIVDVVEYRYCFSVRSHSFLERVDSPAVRALTY